MGRTSNVLLHNRASRRINFRSSKKKGTLEKNRWSTILTLATLGDWETLRAEYPKEYVSRYRTLQKIYNDTASVEHEVNELDNYWYWGPAGSGKSRAARDNYPGAYIKNSNKWWDGYLGEETVIIDELELGDTFMGHFLKLWGDRYPFLGEIKGSGRRIRPLRIVITSNYSIEQIFGSDLELVRALKRRFEEVSFHPQVAHPIFQ